jgi:hypothetical protein
MEWLRKSANSSTEHWILMHSDGCKRHHAFHGTLGQYPTWVAKSCDRLSVLYMEKRDDITITDFLIDLKKIAEEFCDQA